MAHIHQGPATGVRGPAILELSVSKATSGAISGSFDLTPEQIESLDKGKLYVQIHSEKAPDGNLWGRWRRQATIRTEIEATVTPAVDVALVAQTTQQAELDVRFIKPGVPPAMPQTWVAVKRRSLPVPTSWLRGASHYRRSRKYIQTTMPPGGARLSEEASLNVTAFILVANGATPGKPGVDAAANVRIRSIAIGRPAIAIQTASGPRGLTVTGEVKNYIPVTDAMLAILILAIGS